MQHSKTHSNILISILMFICLFHFEVTYLAYWTLIFLKPACCSMGKQKQTKQPHC